MMQEILAKPGYEALPLVEQEFYELCIEESNDIWRPGFIVKQSRAEWSEIDKQFMWDTSDWERWPTLKKAQERYAARLSNLRAQGFTQSDMDLF
jgi:hypothetical protein